MILVNKDCEKIKYNVTNVFLETDKLKKKSKINKIIHSLCINELENIVNMEYNGSNTLFDDALLFDERSISQC